MSNAHEVDSTPGGSRPAGAPALSAVYAITAAGLMANTLIIASLPEIGEYFDVGAAGAGLVVAAGALPGVFVAPIIGALADRWGRRAVVVPCLVVFGVMGGLAGLAPTFPLLLGARLLQGLVSAGLVSLAVVIIGDHWGGLERARLIGHNAAVLTISVAIYPALGGALAALGGTWRAAFIPYPFAVLVAWYVAVQLPKGRQVEAQTGSLLELGRAALGQLARPVVASSVLLGFVAFVLIFGLFVTTMPLLLDQRFALGVFPRGLVMAVSAIGATITALNLRRLRSRWSGDALIAVSFGIFVMGFAVIAAAPILPILILGSFTYGLAEGAAIPTIQDRVVGASADEVRGAVVALFVSGARAGQVVGPLLATGIWDRWPGGTPFAIGATLAAVVAVVLVLGRSRTSVTPDPAL